LNLSSSSFEHHFNSDNYTIEEVKTIGTFNPSRWSKTFKKALTKNIVEAKILHTSTGLEIPLKRYSASQNKQVLEVAGLHSYKEKSKLKSEFIKGNSQELQESFINRIDICIDMEKVPQRVFRRLNSKRKAFPCKNTIYWKTKSEKKSNNQIDVKLYNKALKEKLDYPLFRLEFCFKRSYLQNKKLSQLEDLFTKIEKTIYKFSGLKVKIEAL
jgi:hypothetical protein